MAFAGLLARAERSREHIPQRVADLDDPDHYSDTSRIKGLSDGVFSIAMTLLAFTLLSSLPEAPQSFAEFGRLFLAPLVVYAMTFIILGTYWVGHAIQFHYVVRADRPLMVRTVVFLLFVSLVPFSTAYFGRPAFVFDHVAIALYTVNLMLAGLALNGTLLYASKDAVMLHRVFDRRIFRGIRVSFLLGPLLYGVALVASFFHAQAAFVIAVAVPLLTFFPNPFWGRGYRWLVRSVEREPSGP